MLNPIGKTSQRIEIESSDSKAPLCPKCHTPLTEEWEEEINEYGEKTGYEFEIYQCYTCGYKESL